MVAGRCGSLTQVSSRLGADLTAGFISWHRISLLDDNDFLYLMAWFLLADNGSGELSGPALILYNTAKVLSIPGI